MNTATADAGPATTTSPHASAAPLLLVSTVPAGRSSQPGCQPPEPHTLTQDPASRKERRPISHARHPRSRPHRHRHRYRRQLCPAHPVLPLDIAGHRHPGLDQVPPAPLPPVARHPSPRPISPQGRGSGLRGGSRIGKSKATEPTAPDPAGPTSGSSRASAGSTAGLPTTAAGPDPALEHRDLTAHDHDLRVLAAIGAGQQGEPAEHRQHRKAGKPQRHESSRCLRTSLPRSQMPNLPAPTRAKEPRSTVVTGFPAPTGSALSGAHRADPDFDQASAQHQRTRAMSRRPRR